MPYFNDGSFSSIADSTTPFFEIEETIYSDDLNRVDSAKPGETVLGYWNFYGNWTVAFCRRYEENPDEWIIGEDNSNEFLPLIGWLPVPTKKHLPLSEDDAKFLYNVLLEYMEIEENYDLCNKAFETQKLLKSAFNL